MWTDLMVWLTNRVALRDEEGQTAVEYALVIALIAVIIVGLLATGMGSVFTGFWADVADKLAIT